MERIAELEDVSEHFHHGHRMNEAEATRVEQQIAADPADFVGAMRLVGWAAAREEAAEPGAERAVEARRRLRETWVPQVAVPDPGARLMLGYVPLLARIDPGLAVAWIERAPREGWWGGEAWDRAMANVRLEWAERSEGAERMAQGEAARALLGPMLESGEFPTERGSVGFFKLFRLNLGKAFGKAFGGSDEGHGLAEELEDGLILKIDLAWARYFAGETDEAREAVADLRATAAAEPGLGDRCHHHAEILEGALALARGDRATAVEALGRSVSMLSAEGPLAFTPSLVLARDLLAGGEKKPVVRWLEACARRWDAELRFLQEWATSLNTGERKRLPPMPLLEGG